MSLTPQIRELYDHHAAAPLRTVAALAKVVTAHRDLVHRVYASDAFVDMDLSDQLANACLAILDGFDDRPEDQRRAIQAACTYYASPHDGEDDFTSVTGFDDDAAVINHVARLIGRDDLVIDL